MEVEIFDDYAELSIHAAREVGKSILREPNLILGLPTGKTPAKMYDNLVQLYEEGLIDFSQVETFNLDEFYPISPEDEASYYHYMDKHLYSPAGLSPDQYSIFDGNADDPLEECELYKDKIASVGGVDLQILGIGQNGHIGFNEPGSDWNSGTRLVDLDERTVEEKFPERDSPPRKAFTMGIKNIMQANRIILLASGEPKADIIDRALFGPISQTFPASILQLHPNTSVYLDEKAGKDIG